MAGDLFGTGGDKRGQLVAKERMAAIADKRFSKDNSASSGGTFEVEGVSSGMASVVGGTSSGARVPDTDVPQRSVEGFNVTVTLECPVVFAFPV